MFAYFESWDSVIKQHTTFAERVAYAIINSMALAGYLLNLHDAGNITLAHDDNAFYVTVARPLLTTFVSWPLLGMPMAMLFINGFTVGFILRGRHDAFQRASNEAARAQ